MQQLKKISAKNVIGNVKTFVRTHIENDGDIVDAYSLLGRARGVVTGESQHGAWTAILGYFEAQNYFTGEIYRSSKCFVPEPLQSELVSLLDTSEVVEFSVVVGIKRDDTTTIGYEYVVMAHTRADSEVDVFADLRKTLPRLSDLPLRASGEIGSGNPDDETGVGDPDAETGIGTAGKKKDRAKK